MSVQPMVISRDLVIENAPSDVGEWEIRCECGNRLAFALRGQGSPGFAIVATHGDGEARLEVPGHSVEGLLWSLGMADPLGDWLQRVHEYEGEVAP